jgi:hypothetical protein
MQAIQKLSGQEYVDVYARKGAAEESGPDGDGTSK